MNVNGGPRWGLVAATVETTATAITLGMVAETTFGTINSGGIPTGLTEADAPTVIPATPLAG
jgi:hypothetical protein